jgi:NAD-dependent SIR2 family protein deacetylase
VEQAYALVDSAEVLVVLGSSLTVMSGLRFVRHNVKHQRPAIIINRGPTRGDELALIKVNEGCSEALDVLCSTLLLQA